MKRRVSVAEFMTPVPYAVEPDVTLAEARRLMQARQVRHLPVCSHGQLLGILAERDLYVLSAFPEVDFRMATVGFAMSRDPFTVRPEAPVGDVARDMAARRIGSALVVDASGSMVGIFTESDALSGMAAVVERCDRPSRSILHQMHRPEVAVR